MIRVAALLLVLTFTGTPVVALACVGLCGPAVTTAAASGCHDHPVADAEGLRLAAAHSCDTPLLDTPFLVTPAQRSPNEPVRLIATLPAFSATRDAETIQIRHSDARPPARASLDHSLSLVLRI